MACADREIDREILALTIEMGAQASRKAASRPVHIVDGNTLEVVRIRPCATTSPAIW
jgi:hypothetical protein